jgi:hypothetical protein
MMWDEGNTWKNHEYRRKKGAQIAATYQVTPKFTIRGEVEYKVSDDLLMTNMKDQTSAWDGKTTLATSLPLTGAGAPTTAQLAPLGLVRLTVMRWAIFPDPAWGGAGLNFQNEFRTKGAAHNNNIALTNHINGRPIRTVGYSLNNQAVVDLQGISPDVRWATALAGSPHFNIPQAKENALWDNRYPSSEQVDLSQSLTFGYKVSDHLFVEVAGNINKSGIIGRQTNRRGLNELRIDLHRTLPNGAPNPYYLYPYSEYMDYNNHRSHTFQNARLQAM